MQLFLVIFTKANPLIIQLVHNHRETIVIQTMAIVIRTMPLVLQTMPLVIRAIVHCYTSNASCYTNNASCFTNNGYCYTNNASCFTNNASCKNNNYHFSPQNSHFKTNKGACSLQTRWCWDGLGVVHMKGKAAVGNRVTVTAILTVPMHVQQSHPAEWLWWGL